MNSVPSSGRRRGAAALLLTLVALLGHGIAQAADPVTIARLQLRYGGDGEDDILGATASLYHKLSNELYFLGIYDREGDPDLSSAQERTELYVGRPFTWSPEAARFGWVLRLQNFSSDELIPAAGLQINLNDFDTLAAPLKRLGLYTFLQAFVKKDEPGWGEGELLHYYAFSLANKRVQVRGYNVFYLTGGDPVTLHAWSDFIHPLHRHWDVYVRLNYLSRKHHWLGENELTGFLGTRYNF